MRWNVFIFSSLRSKWNTKRHCWGVVTISRYFKRKKVKTFVSMCRMRDAFSFDCWLILIAICQFCQQQPNFKCYFLAIIRPPSRQFTLSLSLCVQRMFTFRKTSIVRHCYCCCVESARWLTIEFLNGARNSKFIENILLIIIRWQFLSQMVLKCCCRPIFLNGKINTRYLHMFRPFHKRTAVAISLFLVDFIYLFVLHFSIIFNS